jgi:hypothetical protein
VIERRNVQYRHKLIGRYWDGLVIVILCFHIAVFTDQFAFLILSELAVCMITASYITERIRLRFFPQDMSDLANFLVTIGVRGDTPTPS